MRASPQQLLLVLRRRHRLSCWCARAEASTNRAAVNFCRPQYHHFQGPARLMKQGTEALHMLRAALLAHNCILGSRPCRAHTYGPCSLSTKCSSPGPRRACSRSTRFSAGKRSPWGLAAPSVTGEGLQFAKGQPAFHDLVVGRSLRQPPLGGPTGRPGVPRPSINDSASLDLTTGVGRAPALFPWAVGRPHHPERSHLLQAV